MDDLASIFVNPLVNNIIETAGSLIKEGFLAIQGVKKEVEKLSSTLTTIQAVLKDAEERQLDEPHLKDWLAKLRNAAFNIEDILDTYATETFLWKRKQQARNFRSPFSLSKVCFESSAAHKIKEISAELDAIAEEKSKFHLNITSDYGRSQNLPDSTFFVDTTDVFGRESDKETLVNLMLSNEFDMEGDVPVIPIVGMGGLGKTTLAQLVFNDERVKNHFEFRMWVCVTVEFKHRRILEEMMSFLTKTEHLDGLNMSLLESRFVEFLAGKNFFLVLDDVWVEDYQKWEPLQKLLRKGGKGSRVLVTTRTNRVSNIMGTQPPYNLNYLPEDKCWSLFKKIALRNSKSLGKTRKELEDIGRKIVGKCKGLPLAVKAMGGLLQSTVDVNKWEKIVRHGVWELEEGDFDRPRILPALKLSYDHLPSTLKQCFAYCSLFPKSYVFDKEELVKLWMAQAFVQSTPHHSLEEAGVEYFDELLSRSFFQMLNINNKVGYTMHDLIHDLALSVSSPQYCQVEYGTSGIFSEESRHASFHCEDLETPILQIVEKSKKLRTFLLHGNYLKGTGQALQKMFHSLKCLRVLDLNSSYLPELPSSVEELKLLRYLDLSRTQIKVLPNSICNLCNLQTLKLLGCVLLSELPKDLGNLVNLCYLELDEIFWFNCRMLPSKMGNLTTLKKLNAFRVGDKCGHGIKELNDMAYLTAQHISKLENAAEAKLNEKESLQKQVLEWSGRDINEQEVKAQRGSNNFQHLSNLQELTILHFKGSNFPKWMTDGLLQNLVTLSLNHCTKCKTISLGQLPFLRELYIKGMKGLEEWPEDLYTSLCTLHIINCPKLRKVPNFMSNLRVLKIKKCDSLKALPMAPSLLFLELISNLVLEDWHEGSGSTQDDRGNLVGQTRPASVGPLELKLVNCPKIQALPQLCAPQKLDITGCELASVFPVPQLTQRLQHLALDTCSSVTLMKAIPNTNSLCSLVISNISGLTVFPKLHHLPGLRVLYISNCKYLTCLSEGQGSLRRLPSLQLLSIQGCPMLESLPDESLPTALECLMIGSCSVLKSLGAKNTLKSLHLLKDLYVEACPLIQCFPEEGLPPSLQHLKIQGCPLLIEECQKDDAGSTEWPKIMHIPDLEIDSIKLSSNQMCQRAKHGFVDLFAVKL